METIHIDCGGCRNRGPACSNCVVMALLGAEELPEFTAEEQLAVAALAGEGLVPPLRMMPVHRAPELPERRAAQWAG